MKVILSILFLGYVSGQVPIGSRWKELKSPLDTPHYHDIMKKMFPTVTERNHRSGRIAGGDFATLGQFPFQALLMNENSLGDSFLCGGSLISPNWILTVSFVF